jgi:hypothetical protein
MHVPHVIHSCSQIRAIRRSEHHSAWFLSLKIERYSKRPAPQQSVLNGREFRGGESAVIQFERARNTRMIRVFSVPNKGSYRSTGSEWFPSALKRIKYRDALSGRFPACHFCRPPGSRLSSLNGQGPGRARESLGDEGNTRAAESGERRLRRQMD